MPIRSDRNIHRGFHTTFGVTEALDTEARKLGITRSMLIHQILETELISRGYKMLPFVDLRNLEIPFVEGTVHATKSDAGGSPENLKPCPDGMGEEV